MPTTIGVQLTPYAGTATTMTIELLAAGVLLNVGGDTLTEGTNGYFTASIAEDLVAGYNAIIKSNGVAVAEGFLHLGQTVVDREAPVDLTSVITAIGNVPSAEENAAAVLALIGNVNGAGSEYFEIETCIDGVPEPEVEVWITTDENGTNPIAGTKVSSSLGIVGFWLDPGDYFAWLAKTGKTFTNPTPITVPEPD